MNVSAKQKQTHRYKKQTCGYQRWEEMLDRLGIWDWHVHTAVFKMDNQQGPTV